MARIVALEASDAILAGKLRWPAGQGSAAPVANGRLDPRHRHSGGLQKHPITEMCLVLEGGGDIEADGSRYATRPGTLAIIPPGVVHCEAFAAAGRTYTALWMLASGTMVTGAVSRHRPRQAWEIFHGPSSRGGHARRLVRMLEGPGGELRLDALRADLLGVLAELHQRAVYAPPPRDQPASPWRAHQDMLRQIRSFLDENLTRPITVEELAALTRLTPCYLNRLFRQWTGLAIHEYVIRQRMATAMRLCRESELLIKEIAARVGYDDALYFSRAFRRYHGVSPGEARAGQA